MSQSVPGVEKELRKLRQEIELRNLIEVYKMRDVINEGEREVVAGQIRMLAGIDGWVAERLAIKDASE